jgi:putative transposase
VAPLEAMSRQQVRLKRYQRSVSCKKKGSSSRRKAVGRLHRCIARQRSNWLHKLSTSLADCRAVIAIDDLGVKNMSTSRTRSGPANLNRLDKAGSVH